MNRDFWIMDDNCVYDFQNTYSGFPYQLISIIYCNRGVFTANEPQGLKQLGSEFSGLSNANKIKFLYIMALLLYDDLSYFTEIKTELLTSERESTPETLLLPTGNIVSSCIYIYVYVLFIDIDIQYILLNILSYYIYTYVN